MDNQSPFLSLWGHLDSVLASMWTPGVHFCHTKTPGISYFFLCLPGVHYFLYGDPWSAFFCIYLEIWKSIPFTNWTSGSCYCLYVETWESIIVCHTMSLYHSNKHGCVEIHLYVSKCACSQLSMVRSVSPVISLLSEPEASVLLLRYLQFSLRPPPVN